MNNLKPSIELKPVAKYEIMRLNSVVSIFKEAQLSTKTASVLLVCLARMGKVKCPVVFLFHRYRD